MPEISSIFSLWQMKVEKSRDLWDLRNEGAVILLVTLPGGQLAMLAYMILWSINFQTFVPCV